ncbi:ribosomal RNA small subunit methyltransferase A [candidate division KSB1 bacterium]|nr:MAG: ribosomal RNA small subunit methyltransferase A [candidate division KSB1 bacterium]
MTVPPPKKSLGQCFLVERGYARQIADALKGDSRSTVLEIGPGRGILTEELLETGAKVLAVEIDQRLLDPLRGKFGSYANFELRHEDFLDSRLEEILPAGTSSVAGNLPYHLAAEVLFRLIEHAQRARQNATLPWVDSAVLMIQKEVANRVVAKPDSKDWSRLSVFVQLEASVQYLFTVPAGAFRPTPKVDGGVVRLDFFRLPPCYPSDFTVFERIVRYTFHQRRKMLKTSLSGMEGIHPHWQKADFDFARRPGTLSPAEWTMLADVIARARLSRREDMVE